MTISLQLYSPGLLELAVARIYEGVVVAASRSAWDEVLVQRHHCDRVQYVPVCPLEDSGRDPAERVYGQQ